MAKGASLAIVRERIHHTRYSIDLNAQDLLAVHLLLAASLSPRDWEYVDQSTTAQEQLFLKKTTSRQTKKYDRLASANQANTPWNSDRKPTGGGS